MRGLIGADIDVMSDAGINWADIDVFSDTQESTGMILM